MSRNTWWRRRPGARCEVEAPGGRKAGGPRSHLHTPAALAAGDRRRASDRGPSGAGAGPPISSHGAGVCRDLPAPRPCSGRRGVTCVALSPPPAHSAPTSERIYRPRPPEVEVFSTGAPPYEDHRRCAGRLRALASAEVLPAHCRHPQTLLPTSRAALCACVPARGRSQVSELLRGQEAAWPPHGPGVSARTSRTPGGSPGHQGPDKDGSRVRAFPVKLWDPRGAGVGRASTRSLAFLGND